MYKVIKYPDGSSYVETDFDTFEVIRVNSYNDLWILNQLVEVKKSLGVRPTIVIPNLLDAQADRRFDRYQSYGLKIVLEFLNSMEADFVIFHPHNKEVVTALLDNVEVMDSGDFIQSVIDRLYLGRVEAEENLILMSTDAGGFKPLMKICDSIDWKGEVYSASKSRSYENGATKLVQQVDRQDFGGKDVLIVDDICVGGGTFIGLANMLRDRNVGRLFLAISHMSLPELNSPDLYKSYDKVFTTNSKYDEYFYKAERGWVKPDNLVVDLIFKPTRNV